MSGMSQLFSAGKSASSVPMPSMPKPTRMPTSSDASLRLAAKRTRERRPHGRLSTILTDSLAGTSGYGRTKLGA